MDQPAAFSRTLLADRLVQGVRHEARRHRRQDAPADDPAGEDINAKATWTIPIQVDTQVKSDTRNWFWTRWR